jgi:hypothetical protein
MNEPFKKVGSKCRRNLTAADSADAQVASLEWVQNFHACFFEILRLSRGKGEVVLKSGGSNHSIQQRQENERARRAGTWTFLEVKPVN